MKKSNSKKNEKEIKKSKLQEIDLSNETMAERRLLPIQESMIEMYDLTIDLYTRALDIFETRDLDEALKIIESHDEIIKLRDDVNEAVVIYIVKNAPMASDLRKVITILKVVTDLERIAKYSNHFAKFVIKNKVEMASEEIKTSWVKLGTEVLSMLEEVKTLYDVNDKKKILEVSSMQEGINDTYKQIVKLIIKEIKLSDDDNVIDYYAQLLPIVKYQERSGDHAKNICEIFLFLSRGKFYNI